MSMETALMPRAVPATGRARRRSTPPCRALFDLHYPPGAGIGQQGGADLPLPETPLPAFLLVVRLAVFAALRLIGADGATSLRAEALEASCRAPLQDAVCLIPVRRRSAAPASMLGMALNTLMAKASRKISCSGSSPGTVSTSVRTMRRCPFPLLASLNPEAPALVVDPGLAPPRHVHLQPLRPGIELHVDGGPWIHDSARPAERLAFRHAQS